MKPYLGKAYTPKQVRELFWEETPEKFTQHSMAGRRTVASDDNSEVPSQRSAIAITPILQPEWTGSFWRLMSDDQEMAKAKNAWYFPVRMALARLAQTPDDWGVKRRQRRAIVVKAMRMYLFSNYDVPQIAAALGIKRHEAYRALEDASSVMTRWIGVFGEEWKRVDKQGFLEGLKT